MGGGIEVTIGEMAFIHESDSSILCGYATVVGLVCLQCQRTRSVAVLVPFGREISRAIGELQFLAGLRIVCWHEHAITVDGGVTQVGTHDLLDLIDILHADQQCGRRLDSIRFLQGHGNRRRIQRVGHAVDVGYILDHLLADVIAHGHDVDAITGGERTIHSLFGAGGTGCDGGNQGDADEQSGTGCCDASLILLNVGVRNRCGRSCQRGQRSNALHEGRHPEHRCDHHSEEHQCGAGDGYEQNHRELIAARILAAIGGLYLPDGKYHHGDTDHHHQNTDYGSREAGTTVVGQFNRAQCLQWRHRSSGTCGSQGCEHRHHNTEENRYDGGLPREIESHTLLHDVADAHAPHEQTSQHHAKHGCDEAKHCRFEQHGTIQLAFFRADGAQQGECAAALRHEYLERVGDHQCRHEHGKHAEAHEECGDDAGLVAG